MSPVVLNLALLSFFALSSPVKATMRCQDLFLEASQRYPISDIRRYTRAKDTPFKPQVLTISTEAIGIEVGVGQTPRGLMMNFVVTSGSDHQVRLLSQRLVEEQFKDLFVPGHRNTLGMLGFTDRLKNVEPEVVEGRLKAIVQALGSDKLSLIDRIPPTLGAKRSSEQITFLRDLLAQYLSGRGLKDQNDFFKRKLAKIHKEFIADLGLVERTLFHYSIFDQRLTFEAQSEIERRLPALNKLQQSLGLQVYTVDGFVQQLRDNFYQTAKKVHDEDRKRVLNILAHRQIIDLYRQQKFEQTIEQSKAKIASLQEKIKKGYPRSHLWTFQGDAEFYRLTNMLEAEQMKLKSAMDQRESQVAAMTASERAALQEYKKMEQEKANSNFNPYAEDAWDEPKSQFWVKVQHRYVNEDAGGASLPAGGVVADSAQRMLWQQRDTSVFDPRIDPLSDSTLPLKQSGMSGEMVALLATFGITKIHEITKYGAKDYFDKFNMSRESFEKLLDELNVFGIHLHFDSKWDRENHQIRKTRPEYYRNKMVPNNLVRWQPGWLKGDPDRFPEED